MQLLITDIDGVLADPTHRLEKYILNREQKDWDGFYSIEMASDAPLTSQIEVVRNLADESDFVKVVTGRPERTLDISYLWLKEYSQYAIDSRDQIYMRTDGDHRKAEEVKEELAIGAVKSVFDSLEEFNPDNGELDRVVIVEDSPKNLVAMEKAIKESYPQIEVICILLGTGRYDQFNCCEQCTSCGLKDEPGKSGHQCSQS